LKSVLLFAKGCGLLPHLNLTADFTRRKVCGVHVHIHVAMPDGLDQASQISRLDALGNHGIAIGFWQHTHVCCVIVPVTVPEAGQAGFAPPQRNTATPPFVRPSPKCMWACTTWLLMPE
jgi:hypothetical protein